MKRPAPLAPALAMLTALNLAGCEPPAAGEPAVRAELGDARQSAATAPSLQSDCRALEFEGSRFTHCVADSETHTIRMELAGADGAPLRSLSALSAEVDDERVAFAMNGGMYDDASQPIGYYVEDGERLAPLNRAEGGGNFHLLPNGVFFGNDGEWAVRSSDAFFDEVSQRPRFGTQSGPMLLIDGDIHPEITQNGPSRKTRNGVGVDAQGRAHFAISEEPVSFGRFARLFRDRFETPNALFLDGTVSALWDPASNRIDATAPLGPMIVVEKRP